MSFWNFLPPDELNAILTLYTKVTQKTLLISKTLGIEGKKLLTPEDDYDALKEFNQAYEGTKTAVEDMHLEYQALLQDRPGTGGPPQAASRRDLQRPEAPGEGRPGRLLLLRPPSPGQGSWASSPRRLAPRAGTSTTWTATRSSRNRGRSSTSIRSKPDTPRKCTTEETTLVEIRGQGREAHQEHLPEAGRRTCRGQAGAQVLDGTQRGLSRCRPITAPSWRRSRRFAQLIAYLRDEMDWPICPRLVRGR